ncbi:hypothetical protein E2C01_086353 [Portunus trituberculatus]|uniref:Uncharacterized protein n=1 Tax=Portunus trituberculatus TaxID=210409 RepID=A0A5B7JBA2_PORTR|nr:hypothetical protein [Portunus trituberculatus]
MICIHNHNWRNGVRRTYIPVPEEIISKSHSPRVSRHRSRRYHNDNGAAILCKGVQLPGSVEVQ